MGGGEEPVIGLWIKPLVGTIGAHLVWGAIVRADSKR
jgi:hypothetical protein